MSQSVVAVFEDREQAELARDQLVASGYPDDEVQVHLGSEMESGSVAPPASATSDRETEGGIGQFFRSLFGMDDDRPATYEEAARRGLATLVVHAATDEDVEDIRTILERFDVIDIDERATQWQAEGRGASAGMPGETRRGLEGDTSATIPVIEENIQVGKREVERGRVRVYTRVIERPVEESVNLREERARVTRQPADRPATESDMAAFREGSMEIRERAEIPVVEKQARVVEEVQVGKQVQERTETIRDKVRKTDVRVEETEDAPSAATDAATPNSEKRKRR